MKVNLVIESTAAGGDTIKSSTAAILEETENNYKVTYMEELSDSGQKAKTTMYITSTSLRIIREGEAVSDFIYAEGLEHNSVYRTMYGEFPLCVVTKSFHFIGNRMSGSEDLFCSYPGVRSRAAAIRMRIDIEYALILAGQEPLDMKVSININT